MPFPKSINEEEARRASDRHSYAPCNFSPSNLGPCGVRFGLHPNGPGCSGDDGRSCGQRRVLLAELILLWHLQGQAGFGVNVFVAPSRDEIGKFQAVVHAFPSIWEGLILDVGCRSANLRRVLEDREVHYRGLDLFPPADFIGDLGAGLPFEDMSFDTVVALDVLEHTDNIYQAFGELCRVARKYAVVTLPNAYEVKSRIKFLLGRRLSGKYGLPLEPPNDRHRWLFSLREAMDFIHARVRCHDCRVAAEGCLVGPGRGFMIGRLMVGYFPNLLSPWYLALLQKKSDKTAYES